MANGSLKTLKRTYYPSRTFDDDLDAFAQLAKAENWNFPGVDAATIAQDSIDQRSERARLDAAESQFYRLHETFGLAQQARHERFSAALNAARGAFRNNKAVVAQLDRFRRSGGRRSKAAADTAKITR